MNQSFDVEYFNRNISIPNNVRHKGVLEVNESGLTIYNSSKSIVMHHLNWNEFTARKPPTGIEHVTITLKKQSMLKFWKTYGIYFSDRSLDVQNFTEAIQQYGKELEPATTAEKSAQQITLTLIGLIFGVTIAGALFFYFA